MCLLCYFDRKYMMHTGASDSLMYNEMKNSEQEQNIILSIIWQQMLTEMFAFITQSLLKTKQMAKSTLKVKMNDRLVNLHVSAQEDVNKTCGLVYAFNLFGFTFHTAFWLDNHNGTGQTKSWQNDKEAAHSDSNLYSVLQLEASSPIENYTLRKLSPCLSALECKHTESTNNCREKQRLLSIGRDAEEILNSYTNCKYKLLNGTRTTWQCIVWTFIVRRQASKDTGDSFTRTYFTHPKVCQGGMRVNLARLTVPLWIHCECRRISRHAVAFKLHGDFIVLRT